MPPDAMADPTDDVQITIVGAERVDELEGLWRELHGHHHAVSAVPIQPDPDLSWSLCRAQYARHLGAGEGFLVVADRDGVPIGYAMVVLRSGPDDTYAFPGTFAEVVTLVVGDRARGGGIGGRLLDASDAELARRGVTDQVIAVMAGNDAAQRLYERRGFVPGEIILFRQGPPQP